MHPGYEHTQRGPLWLLLILPLAAALVVGAYGDLALRCAAAGFAAALAVLAACFVTLTVRDRGDHLDVRFGPLPLFGTRVRYDAIDAVAPTRSRLIDGFGVHWLPGRGWTFNLWGFDCVEVTTGRRRVRIGTDEPEALARFLAARTRERRPERQ